jgi:hypothetical protein
MSTTGSITTSLLVRRYFNGIFATLPYSTLVCSELRLASRAT